MPAQRYFPQSEADRIAWLNNYAAKLPVHGPSLGLSGEEIGNTQADIAYLVWLLHTWNPAIQQDALQATAFKNLIASGNGTLAVAPPAATVFSAPPGPRPPGVLNRLYNQVQRLKLHAAYSEAIGQDLGVIAVADSSEHPVPVFSATLEQGPHGSRVRLDYTKYGHDGVAIDSRVAGGAWQFLASATQKPTYDERPLATPQVPEIRDYRLRWWDKDQANGEWSAVQTVLVGA